MIHKVKVTVLDTKLYPQLQKEYCADANVGPCPCYNAGDEFVFYRDDDRNPCIFFALQQTLRAKER